MLLFIKTEPEIAVVHAKLCGFRPLKYTHPPLLLDTKVDQFYCSVAPVWAINGIPSLVSYYDDK